MGCIRDINDDQLIQQLELEHYPGMTEKVLPQGVKEATDRWAFFSARVIHRVGPLAPGKNIVLVRLGTSLYVLVLTSSAHRHASLDTCALIMNHLKTRATFWKKNKHLRASTWLKVVRMTPKRGNAGKPKHQASTIFLLSSSKHQFPRS